MKIDANNNTHAPAGPGGRRPGRTWSQPLECVTSLLDRCEVVTEIIDEITVRLAAVPVGSGFSKQRTNLLLRRVSTRRAGAVAFVDGDLKYTGPDGAMGRALTGPCRRNWRRLVLPVLTGDVNDSLCRILELLGSPVAPDARAALEQSRRESPCEPTGRPGPTLAALGEPIGPEAAAEAFEKTFRKDLATEIAIALCRPEPPRSVVVWGPSGSGKDLLAVASVHPLLSRGEVCRVIRVSAGAVAAGSIFPPEADAALLQMLSEARALDRAVLLINDLDACLTRSPVCASILCDAIDGGVRLLATARSEAALGQLGAVEAVARRLLPVYVGPPDRAQVEQILRRIAETSPAEVAPAAIQAILRVAYDRNDAVGEPAGSISLLTAAICRAGWDHTAVDPDAVFAVLRGRWPENTKE